MREEGEDPLLASGPEEEEDAAAIEQQQQKESNGGILIRRTCLESKKIWAVAGPSIFGRLALFSMTVITQAFAGHIDDLDLAAFSMATTVFIAITYGFLLGMASALETLCGQAYGAKQLHMLGIYMQRSWIVLFISSIILLPLFVFASPLLKLIGTSTVLADKTAFVGLWEFFKLAFATGVMLALENFYYRVLIILSGIMKNAEATVDALSICITIFAWESIIPLGFFAATGYVNVWVAVGSGWQAVAAFVNLGSYYIVGFPLGVVFGWLLNFGIKGIWAGMISGTVVQTLILIIITIRCNWGKEAQKARIRMAANQENSIQ